MAKLQDRNVTVNLEKSVFSKAEIDFCGYKVSREGISLLQSHLRAIIDTASPQQCERITKLPRVVWVVLSVGSRLHKGGQHDGAATEEGCALQLDLRDGPGIPGFKTQDIHMLHSKGL